ncbi:MAG: RNA-binding domain-containing protein [Pseudomonadota bacterium]
MASTTLSRPPERNYFADAITGTIRARPELDRLLKEVRSGDVVVVAKYDRLAPSLKTLRTNLHTGQIDDKMHLTALKTIAGFLNAKGGTLLIGVADSGEVLGLDADGFPNEDKMGLHLVNLIKDRVGEVFLPYVHYRFGDQDGKRTLVVRCDKGPKPAFVKDSGSQRFFVRGGASSQELQGTSVTDYVKQRFA